MKKNGLQIITRRMVIFNTPCCIWQLVAQVGISRSNSLSNNFANKKRVWQEAHSKVLFYVNGSKEKTVLSPSWDE